MKFGSTPTPITSTFTFSPVNLATLGATEYTLVGVTADRSGSVRDFAREMQATIVELEGRLERSRDYIDELSRRLEASTTRWTEWAAKILAAYPWVGEFHPEDGDDKYRDGVRYVLLCIESNGSSDPGIWTEMQAIKAKWGFS